MRYYKGLPITVGKLEKNTLKARCPYCNDIEYFLYSKTCSNPTRRMSHCKYIVHDYYYIYIPKKLRGGETDGKQSDI